MTQSRHPPISHPLPLRSNLLCLVSVVPRTSTGMVGCTGEISSKQLLAQWPVGRWLCERSRRASNRPSASSARMNRPGVPGLLLLCSECVNSVGSNALLSSSWHFSLFKTRGHAASLERSPREHDAAHSGHHWPHHNNQASATTGLCSVPMPSIVTSMVSPGTVGPTPNGVPLMMMSPGSNVTA